MELIEGIAEFQLHDETAVALGKFDGVHVGHRRLLADIAACRDKGLKACVFTFDPAPAVLFGLSDGKELSTREEKRRIFEKMGVDILIEFPLNIKTASISPEEFVRQYLLERMRARYIAAGEDVSFGKGGEGDAAMLKDMGSRFSFQVEIIDKVNMDGEEVSSTRIRRCIDSGDMVTAGKLLGAPYTVSGNVMKGNQIGRTLGFPTVNLLPESNKMLPPNGVYYSHVRYGDRIYPAISNVGFRPTVSGERDVWVESYLYNFDGDLYGQNIDVELLEYRRREQRFENVEFLKEQIKKDIDDGAKYHAGK